MPQTPQDPTNQANVDGKVDSQIDSKVSPIRGEQPPKQTQLDEPGIIAPGEQYPTTQPGSVEAPYALAGLGIWNYYFALKLALFFRGNMGFHALENLAFAAFLLISFSSKIGRSFKAIASVTMGTMLFYYDTWLPSVNRVWSQVEALKGFSFDYFVELGLRYISLEFVALAFLLYIVLQYADRFIRTSVVMVCVLSFMTYQSLFPSYQDEGYVTASETANGEFGAVDARSGGFDGSSKSSLDDALTQFYSSEKRRKTKFSAIPADAAPFDILLLNVCSLSWDDLEYTGLHLHPVFNEFDIVMSNFSAAASYSGPAAIRLMRASCGQSNHSDLYRSTPKACNLFDNLANLGFEKQMFMNHDGNFDNFLPLVQKEGGLNDKLLDMSGVDVAQYSFDGTPILGDLASLEHWLSTRNNNDAERMVHYYNSISLHDGNRLAGQQANLNSLENFHPRMTTFLTELGLFFESLKQSNRRVMVIMVPEHGAAARGDAMQAAAFREIPSPSITNVPVGIKFFGPNYNDVDNQTIEVKRPASYLAVSHIIASAVSQDPYQANFKVSSLLTDLPETNFVSENDGTVVAKKGSQYFVKFNSSDWMKYPDK